MTTPCPRCGREIINARVTPREHRQFDATPVQGGGWSVYQARDGSRWYTQAAERQVLGNPDPLPGTGHRLHECPGAAGTQLEFSTEAHSRADPDPNPEVAPWPAQPHVSSP